MEELRESIARITESLKSPLLHKLRHDSFESPGTLRRRFHSLRLDSPELLRRMSNLRQSNRPVIVRRSSSLDDSYMDKPVVKSTKRRLMKQKTLEERTEADEGTESDDSLKNLMDAEARVNANIYPALFHLKMRVLNTLHLRNVRSEFATFPPVPTPPSSSGTPSRTPSVGSSTPETKGELLINASSMSLFLANEMFIL